MGTVQTRTLVILLGVGTLIAGIFATYNQPEMELYRMFSGVASAFGGQGMSTSETLRVFIDLYIKAPYLYIGLGLVLVGIFMPRSTRAQTAPTTYAPELDLFRECKSCGQPVRESASFCPHCSAPQ